MPQLKQLGLELTGCNQTEKRWFRRLAIGTFIISQIDTDMRGAGSVALGVVTAVGVAATYLLTPEETSSSQTVLGQTPSATIESEA